MQGHQIINRLWNRQQEFSHRSICSSIQHFVRCLFLQVTRVTTNTQFQIRRIRSKVTPLQCQVWLQHCLQQSPILYISSTSKTMCLRRGFILTRVRRQARRGQRSTRQQIQSKRQFKHYSALHRRLWVEGGSGGRS